MAALHPVPPPTSVVAPSATPEYGCGWLPSGPWISVRFHLLPGTFLGHLRVHTGTGKGLTLKARLCKEGWDTPRKGRPLQSAS